MDPALLGAMFEAAGDDADMGYQVWAFASGQGGRFKQPFKHFTLKCWGQVQQAADHTDKTGSQRVQEAELHHLREAGP